MKRLTLESFLQQSHPSAMQKVVLVLSMSLPAILAQLTSIAMQYIDAGMVGSLGAAATGAIGLVSSTTWLMNGMCVGMSSGFSVQVAQLVGAGRKSEAADVLRQALKILFCCSFLLMVFCISISHGLPVFLGADETIREDAGRYFFIYACGLPFAQIRQLSAAMMQCSGDMKTPSVLAGMVCVLDVIFNYFLIFPTRTVEGFGLEMTVFGAGLGVEGAALGTALSEVVIGLLMLYFTVIRSPILNLRRKGDWKLKRKTVVTAVKIAVPMTLDHIFLCSAYVAGTLLIAPLGTVAVAANSLAVTAESLCYMPGYGIGSASTAIIGQTLGAERLDLTRSFSRLTVLLGMVLMGFTGMVMYGIAPIVFQFLTTDGTVASLGTQMLRIELFAEPLYGASICCAGVFRGAGDTLFPSIMNLVSMWGVRILLAFFLIPVFGLKGYWIAMTVELCFRGLIFLFRLKYGRWMKRVL
ncbi:MAG: MATE family efflux transporter [Lachnospiraceae bacterium]